MTSHHRSWLASVIWDHTRSKTLCHNDIGCLSWLDCHHVCSKRDHTEDWDRSAYFCFAQWRTGWATANTWRCLLHCRWADLQRLSGQPSLCIKPACKWPRCLQDQSRLYPRGSLDSKSYKRCDGRIVQHCFLQSAPRSRPCISRHGTQGVSLTSLGVARPIEDRPWCQARISSYLPHWTSYHVPNSGAICNDEQ